MGNTIEIEFLKYMLHNNTVVLVPNNIKTTVQIPRHLNKIEILRFLSFFHLCSFFNTELEVNQF